MLKCPKTSLLYKNLLYHNNKEIYPTKQSIKELLTTEDKFTDKNGNKQIINTEKLQRNSAMSNNYAKTIQFCENNNS